MTEQVERVAKAIRDQNRFHMQRAHPEMTFERDTLTADDLRLARAAIAALTVTPQEAAKVTTDNDLYYLRCISRRLAEFQEAMDGIDALTIGGEAMADERDWLEDYIDQQARAISEDSHE